MLLKRIATGLILAFGSIALVIWCPFAFLIEVVLVSALGVKEYFSLTIKNNHILRIWTYVGVVSSIVYTACSYYLPDKSLLSLAAFIVLVMLIIHIINFMKRNFTAMAVDFSSGSKIAGAFSNISLIIFGFIYITYLLSFLILIRKVSGTFFIYSFEVEAGACFVTYLIFITAFCDAGAFFIGKYFGKNKLWPLISPNKTIEGAFGGLICSVAVAYLLGNFLGFPAYRSVFLGLTLAIAAQLGDLFESMLKREAGVKDSGNLLAGHGGVLDRFDSYFFTAPLMYIFIIGFL